MIRRIKRAPQFDLSFQIKQDSFISTPREYQRNWLLNRTINEFANDLNALDNIAAGFVTGSQVQGMEDRTQAQLADQDIMEDWQIPIMKAMASAVTEKGGDILEIGFGRGVGSGFIQSHAIASHTIIECNDSIVARFEQWQSQYPGKDIQIKPGLWQDVLPGLPSFDGIFFHTYPLKEDDFVEQIAESSTFAEHFFPHAAAHLHQGGIFTYLSNEIDSLSRNHQRLLFRYFKKIELQLINDLPLPEYVKDQWWAKSMVLVKAIK